MKDTVLVMAKKVRVVRGGREEEEREKGGGKRKQV